MFVICTFELQTFQIPVGENLRRSRLTLTPGMHAESYVILQPLYALCARTREKGKPTRHFVQYGVLCRHPHCLLLLPINNIPRSRWTVYSFEMRQSEIALGLQKNSLTQVIRFHDVFLDYMLT